MDLKNNKITVREILANPSAMKMLEREFPGAAGSPILCMTLESLIEMARSKMPQQQIDRLLQELQNI